MLKNCEQNVRLEENIHEILKFVICKNRKKKKVKANKHRRQYLCDSIICLRPRSCNNFTMRKIQEAAIHFFFLSQNNTLNPNMKQQYFTLAQRIYNGLKNLLAQASALWTKPKKISVKNRSTFISG